MNYYQHLININADDNEPFDFAVEIEDFHEAIQPVVQKYLHLDEDEIRDARKTFLRAKPKIRTQMVVDTIDLIFSEMRDHGSSALQQKIVNDKLQTLWDTSLNP
jgi:adenine specific DNA methylase Mod